MPNVTLALDKEMLEKSRAYAQDRGISLNALVRELLEQRVCRPDAGWIDACFERMDRLAIDSGGRQWTREELYDV